jgi:hypothetical protein
VVSALLATWFVTGALVATAWADLPEMGLPNPRLSRAFPAGGQAGTTVEVVVSGHDLVDARELLFNHPGITAKLKMAEPGLGQTGPQPVYGTFDVRISPDVPAGAYALRVLGKFGVSNPRMFCVGVLPEIREVEPNNVPQQAQEIPLETTVNGTCDLATSDFFKFSARQGQRVIIDCQAFRIDSRLDGTLVLFDATGRELERSYNVNRRDPLIDFTVPQDGEYLVSLQDQTLAYRMVPAESFYRLTISTLPFLDFIFPPVGQPGSNGQYTLYGRNLPGGKKAPGVEVGGKTLESLVVAIPLPAEKSHDLDGAGGMLVEPSESFLDGIVYRLQTPRGPSNPVLLTMTSSPIVLEQEPNNLPAQAPLLVPPCEYAGQFYPSGDRDWVSFRAKKDEVYWIDLICQRLGNPTDPRMVIQQVKRDDQGQEQIVPIQVVDDDLANSARVHWSMLDSILYSQHSYDPVYRFVAPEEGTYRILLQDLSRPAQDLARSAKGNARFTYRLAIRPPEPDFRLVAVPRPPTNRLSELSNQSTNNWATVLRQGGADMIDIYAYRRDGFDGEIEVTADRLPRGVISGPIVIAPNETSATLVLTAADDAPAGWSAVSIQGKSRIGQSDVVRQARPATMNWAMQELGVTYHRSRLADQFPVAVIAQEQAPYTISVEPDLRLETALAGTARFPVRVVRRGNFQGAVELFAYGLPPSSSGPLHAQPKYHAPLAIPANQNSIEFTLTVPASQPPGTYSFFISGVGTVSYAANPEKLQESEARLVAIEKIAAENDARLKTVTAAQSAAAKSLADAQAANQNVQAATEAKAAADKAVAEADAKAKRDAAFLLAFRQEVSLLKEQCKPADVKISHPSNRATLKMSPAPFEIQLAANDAAVKQGAKLELPVTIKRLYGFADPIQIQFMGVFNISGVVAPVVTIPAGQTQGVLVIDAAAGTAAGRHKSSVRGTCVYNGQPLFTSKELTLIIEPAELTKK